jgi:anti-sigma regulatory factor (Ser/Thr protein kinase)
MRCTLRGDLNAPAVARQRVSEQLTGPDFSTEVVSDVVLAVSELVTNAIEAGATAVQLGLNVTRHEIQLSVGDNTGGWPRPTRAPSVAPRGRGLAIVSQLADTWQAERTDAGKRITAHFVRK